MDEMTFYAMLILILIFVFFCGFFMSFLFKKNKSSNPTLEDRMKFIEKDVDRLQDQVYEMERYFLHSVQDKINRYKILDAPVIDDEQPKAKERKKPGPKPGFKKKKVENE